MTSSRQLPRRVQGRKIVHIDLYSVLTSNGDRTQADFNDKCLCTSELLNGLAHLIVIDGALLKVNSEQLNYCKM